MPPATRLRVATVNVNGIRAAFRKGMREWLAASDADIVAMQEVRASTDDAARLLGDEWDLVHDASRLAGRAGVAIASRHAASIHRVAFGDDDLETSGRWIEADYTVNGAPITIVSTYVPTGEALTPRQAEKFRFLDAFEHRLAALAADGRHAIVTGDLNIAHRQVDIRNWKGNRAKAGFLPEERAYLDRILGTGPDARSDWVDVGRRFAGEIDGPYTWWSMRGKAFDNDTGWRIDYQFATTALAATVTAVRVDRAPSWGERWSDHAPLIVDYAL